VRVAVAVPKIKPADCFNNAEEIIKLMREAAENQVKVLVFPELSITGYTCGDMFMQDTLINASEAALDKILKETADLELFAAVGSPVRYDNQLYNCAVCICKGEIFGVVPKKYLSNDEKRWFSPDSSRFMIFRNNGDLNFNIGVEIGGDVCNIIPPSTYHALAGADIILNLSAQNELVYKDDSIRKLIAQQSDRIIGVYAYANAGYGESTTDSVFSGNSFICESGEILKETEKFKRESQLVFVDCDIAKIRNERKKIKTLSEFDKKILPEYVYYNFELDTHIDKLERKINPHPFIPSEHERDRRCSDIFNIQIAGLAKRLEHTKVKTAVLAVSGGLDSTLALLVTVKAFDYLGKDRKDIIGITMPGFGTTDRTKNNAVELMEKLDITHREISIKESVLLHFRDIGHDPDIIDLTYENAQARERMQIPMDVACKENGFVVGTGDMSEIALGISTYNGDHMSMYNVNCGIPKTLIRVLISHIANNITPEVREVLRDICDTPVSPELLPANKDGEIEQKTEDIFGPYELHDFFLYYMIRFGFTPKKILYLAEHAFENKYNKDEIKKWLKVFYKRFFANQFKRSCMPDGPKVFEVGLSPRGDLKMPSDLCGDVWLKEIDGL
jgi:NAD+ synthase (glutamine-hydrolysing)